MKKALTISSIALFLMAVILFSVLYGSKVTIAEICKVDEATQIVSIEFVSQNESGTSFWGERTQYTSGEVYDRFAALFWDNRFSGKDMEGFFSTGIYTCAKIIYHMDNGKNIALIVPPDYGKTVDGVETPAYLMTHLDMPREEYLLDPQGCISFEEIERLARAGNE